MLITKLDIKSFGPYREYDWKKNIPEEEKLFSCLNIFYGRNYSGKTSLSRIFRALETNFIPDEYKKSEFTFTLFNGSELNVSNINSCPYVVKVYNSDFVNENLAFLRSENEDIKAFAILGEDNIKIQEEINELKQELGHFPENEGLQQREQQAANDLRNLLEQSNLLQNKLEQLLREKAKNIKNNAKIYDAPIYTIANIKDDIEKLTGKYKDCSPLSKLEREMLQKNLFESAKEIPKLTLLNMEFYIEELIFEINLNITKKIQPTSDMNNLLNNALLQEWIRTGQQLHQKNNSLEECLFCKSPIDETLWNMLSSHFNKESELVRTSLNNMKSKIELLKKSLEEEDIPHKSDFYLNLENEWLDSLEKYRISKQKIESFIVEIEKDIEEKLKDIFTPLKNIESDKSLLADRLEVKEQLNQIVIKHTEKTSSLTQIQNDARSTLLNDDLMNFLRESKYNEHLNQIKSLEEETKNKDIIWKDIEEQYELKMRQLKNFESKLTDVGFAADRINNILFQHFGHNNLELKPTIDLDSESQNYNFKVYRGDNEAKNLSDGEKSLLAFCYYITQVEALLNNPDNNEKLIIYIDDPISSLDNGHIFFIFSLIENIILKNKSYLQVFLSTHNLDFLKYLKRISVKKAIEDTEPQFIRKNYYLIERYQEQFEVSSVIRKMPEYLSNYTSEFHFLFDELVKFIKPIRGGSSQLRYEKTPNTYYNIPNNLRKFLEYYLIQRFPCSSKENPLNNLEKLFSEGTCTRVNRIINEYSHLTYADRAWKPLDIPELEQCVIEVIFAINDSDGVQLHELLDLVGESGILDKLRPNSQVKSTMLNV